MAKVKVVFDETSHRKPYIYEFVCIPRKGEEIAAPTPGAGPDVKYYEVDQVLHCPTNSSCPVEIHVLRINPENV